MTAIDRRLANTERIEVGERVIAIGSPMGLPATVSEGIISGTRREANTNVRFLQTTAAVSPGSSGGPLIRQDARVVGVNTFGLEGGQNLNFATPSDYVISILRKPAPRGLRSAGTKCKSSQIFAQTQDRQSEQQAVRIIETMIETIGSLIDLRCAKSAKTNKHYQNCLSREIVKIRGLMNYLSEKTKTTTDAADILLNCDNSWSRHGGLWNFTYFDICVRSEISQYRLRGYRVK